MKNQDIDVTELKRLRDENIEHILIDVREPYEYEAGNINGRHIPLGQLPDRLDEIDRTKHIIVHCKGGGRSGQAANFLRGEGFEDVSNLKGGLGAWAAEFDPDLEVA